MLQHDAWPVEEVPTQLSRVPESSIRLPGKSEHWSSHRVAAQECAAAPPGSVGGAVGSGSGIVPLCKRMPIMNTSKAKSPAPAKQTRKQAPVIAPPTSISSKPASKQQYLATLLVRDEGATLDQMIDATGWLPHTTRAALTGLKKKGYGISSDKADGVRTYRAVVPRCLARTRSGTECQSPAVKGKRRCRMHGGTNPGPPKGNRNAWKHGGRSAEAMAASYYVRMIAKLVREEID